MKRIFGLLLFMTAFTTNATVYVVGPGETVPVLDVGDVAYVTTENGSTWTCSGTSAGGTTCNRTSPANDSDGPWL